MDPATAELIKQLGIAAPLIGILVYLLRQSTAERQQITTQFLQTLSETVKQNAVTSERVSTNLAELTAAIRDATQNNQQEHRQMLDLLQKMQTNDRLKP